MSTPAVTPRAVLNPLADLLLGVAASVVMLAESLAFSAWIASLLVLEKLSAIAPPGAERACLDTR